MSLGEAQYAKSQPVTKERIYQQMNKLGNTPYMWEELDIQMGDSVFIPMKVLNEVRHQALKELEEQILIKYRRPSVTFSENITSETPNISEDRLLFYASCEDSETARMLCEEEQIRGIYLPYRLMEQYLELGLEKGKEMYLSLPHITRGEEPDGYCVQIDKWLKQGMTGFLVRNLESLSRLKNRGLLGKCVLDHSLYTWNDEAVRFWEKQGVLRNTVPLELNEKELRHRQNKGSEMLIYGRLPLMISAQCVRKNTIGCNHQEEKVWLKDRYEKEFPAVCCCDPWKTGNTKGKGPCYNIIYNSLPYGLPGEADKVRNLGVSCVRLSFTIESAREAGKILKDFTVAYSGGRISGNYEFTKGHFKRGAE